MLWSPRETVLYEGQGQYSPVKVTKRGSRVNLYTGNNFLQSSYDFEKEPTGTVFDWYLVAPWFLENFTGQFDSLLLLGLGAGSQVKLFNKAYTVKSITGVEIDPIIVKLGQEYFDLNDNNLKIVVDDVSNYIKNSSETFEVIILDAYRENKYDAASGSKELLEEISKKLTGGGVLLINRVFGETSNLTLEKDLLDLFDTVFALRVHNNVFYMGTNSGW